MKSIIHVSALLSLIASAPFALSSSQSECVAGLDDKLPNIIPRDFNFSGNVRTYFVQAEQQTWNYIPSGWDNWLGVPADVSPRVMAAGYTKAAGSLGLEWQKAFYRGYTNASFVEKSWQPPQHGINGPILRAEVGDMIQILFRNNLTSNYASMHSMGLAYSKEYEGSLYASGINESASSLSAGDAVPAGGCFVYKWLVNEGSSPYEGENSKMWSYHSFINMQADLNTGLMGPTVVYNRGTMAKTMASHRELFLNYFVFDETKSWLASTNLNKYGNATTKNTTGTPMPVTLESYYAGNMSYWKPQLTNMPTVTLSQTLAPMFYALNGYTFANSPKYEMCLNEPVIWYVYAFGADSHVFHMHGNSFKFKGDDRAAKSLNDGNMFTLQMNATAGPATWQFICHVSNHFGNGMEGLYTVHPNGTGCPLPALAAV